MVHLLSLGSSSARFPNPEEIEPTNKSRAEKFREKIIPVKISSGVSSRRRAKLE